MPSAREVEEAVDAIAISFFLCLACLAVGCLPRIGLISFPKARNSLDRDFFQDEPIPQFDDADRAWKLKLQFYIVCAIAIFPIVLIGSLPLLMRAFPRWSALSAGLVVILAILIARLIHLNQENVEDYSIKPALRAAIDEQMEGRRNDMHNLALWFGVWIVCMTGSVLNLMNMTHRNLADLVNLARHFWG